MYDNEMRSYINTHYLLLGVSELSGPWGPWLTWNMAQGKLSNANPLPHFSSICWCVTTWWYLFSKFGLCHVVIKSLLRRPIYLRSVWMLSPLEWWWIKGAWCTQPCDKGYRHRDKQMLSPGFWREHIEAFGNMGPHLCSDTSAEICSSWSGPQTSVIRPPGSSIEKHNLMPS